MGAKNRPLDLVALQVNLCGATCVEMLKVCLTVVLSPGYRTETRGELLRNECESLTLTAFHVIDPGWSSGWSFFVCF